jgi:hypothetical protein
LQQDEGIFVLASLLPIGITISRRSAVPFPKLRSPYHEV